MIYVNVDINTPSKARLELYVNGGFKLGNNMGDSEVFDRVRAKKFLKTVNTFDRLVVWDCVEKFINKEK